VDTKGSKTAVLEAGHAYLDLLNQGEEIPAPDEETLREVADCLEGLGYETDLICVVDDTPQEVENIDAGDQSQLVDDYVSGWSETPSVYYESQAIPVLGSLETSDELLKEKDSKWTDFTCSALDTAMVLGKLGLLESEFPEADLAITQHDKNYPLPYGGHSSFHDFKYHDQSHEIQEKLVDEFGQEEGEGYKLTELDGKHHLEFNPAEVDNGVLTGKIQEVAGQ
jgi:hypothetical protein